MVSRQVSRSAFCSVLIDLDTNRGYLLEAGVPQAVVSLLEGYADKISPSTMLAPLDLSVSHLQVVRTAIGVLLNASLGFGLSISLFLSCLFNLLGLQIL